MRVDRNLTQQEAADKSGLIQQTVSDYECGKRTPSLNAACKLAQAFEVTVDEIARAIQEQKAE